MVLNPPDNIVSRPDYTTRVDQANNRQLNPRSKLPPDEDRLSFTLLAAEGQGANPFPYVCAPLSPGEERSLVVGETGKSMPIQPNAGLNIISESVSGSVSNAAQLRTYVDGFLANAPYIRPGVTIQEQIAALQELVESVTSLDGSHTIEFSLVNKDPTNDLEASIRLRAIQRSVE